MATNYEKAGVLYRNTYNSIAGVDIKAVFFGQSFGNLQAVSYSITREKAPVYTMGSPECRGYARGKRAIAGNLVFVMFDDHALLSVVEKLTNTENFDKSAINSGLMFVSDFDEIRPVTDDMVSNTGKKASLTNQGSVNNYLKYEQIQQGIGNNGSSGGNNFRQAYNIEGTIANTLEEDFGQATPWYSDQIPAFNIVLTGVNEDGFAATMSILGVEILNEGYGISIDDLISEQQMTYVARAIARWRTVGNPFAEKDSQNSKSIPLFQYR